jgi:methyltransferase family protein
MRALKKRFKKTLKQNLRRSFELGQRFGVDILPRHFYSEIPDIRVLRSTTAWRAPRSMHGILGDIEAQLRWVDQCTARYRDNIRGFHVHENAVRMNGSDEGYGQVEADFLYCFVRSIRPQKILQIGCGVSTAICLTAAADEGYTPQITCIEPYPTEFLKREHEAGTLLLLPSRVEETGLELVPSLKSGDLFFVDSSHTLAPAGEVNLIVLEALSRISSGVYAHFHDIHFPYDYSPDILSSALFFQHETALLYAFLLMNDRFEIAASLSMLHHMKADDLVRCFPDMQPREFDEGISRSTGHYPSSVFLRRIGE